MINIYKIEIKNNYDDIYKLPKILQIYCSNINLNYIKYHIVIIINKLINFKIKINKLINFKIKINKLINFKFQNQN